MNSILELFFSRVNELFESFDVVYSEVSQHFAVNFNACFVKAVDEVAVGQAEHTGSCIDTSDPEFTDFAFCDMMEDQGEDGSAAP